MLIYFTIWLMLAITVLLLQKKYAKGFTFNLVWKAVGMTLIWPVTGIVLLLETFSIPEEYRKDFIISVLCKELKVIGVNGDLF